MAHSWGSVTRAKMYAPIIVLICSIVGSGVGYNVQRELPYNIGPNDPFAVEINRNFGLEPSQQLFWGNGGSNQVGGNGGLWSKITSKFPFLENMFGRMQLPTQYGLPNVQQQYSVPNTPQQYFSPQQYQAQQYQAQQYQPQQYQPQQFQPQQYQQQQFQPQQFQPQQYQQQQFQPQQFQPQQYFSPQQFQPQLYRAQYQQQLLPSARDVGLTDDAVIVTPPQVPIFPQPVPQPVPVPAPAPAPAPAPEPSPGYNYNKPQYRLELPRK